MAEVRRYVVVIIIDGASDGACDMDLGFSLELKTWYV